jgi:hypothetical protein
MYPQPEAICWRVQDIKYVSDVDKNFHITIYKGDYDGPVIATAIQSHDKGGVTKIKMTESSQSLHMKEGHGLFSSNTLFEIDGKKVRWRGQSELSEEGTGICLATYKAKSWESEQDRKLGTLRVTEHGLKYIDAIVCSALIKQERTDEPEYMV